MIKYVAKRLLLLIPILIGVAFIIFTIMEFTPGDPAIRILGIEAPREALEQLREQLGLNRPFFTRFFDYIFKIVTQLDFGISWRTKNPVFYDIMPRIPVSVTLAFLGIVFATIIGIPLGVLSAVKQYSPSDNILRVVSTILVAVPTFWLAMLLILLFSSYLAWLPSSGVASWKSYIMPVITCGGPYGCAILRMTRSTMLEEIRQDYVRTARAKGVPNNIITYKHALKNALLPVVTTIGQNFGAILGGSVVAESVFSLPGIGSLVILGIKSKDTPTVIASVLLIAFYFAIIMLFVDLVYAFIDPRIKAKYSKVN
ncbi:MAG: ABC transporter permease [Sedimentibacter sp.]|uniref:ABC transporter permease n=1 Tax=Sedimentibacter sp. TaxID=1960295 RepID=UPI002980CFE0|nr:ABC transporter permease [Sedimentibacter sp.]MDW5299573.1 ABC transporter permease [Sedimentibacter sp.]